MKQKFTPFTIILLSTCIIAFMITSCAVATESPQPEPSPASTATGKLITDTPIPTPTTPFGELLVERTPEPTATPGRLERRVTQLVIQSGLARKSFLGLAADDWINLGISILYVLIAFLVGTWLIRGLLPRVTRRTPIEIDDSLLLKAGSDLRWLITIVVLNYATKRLTFVDVNLKTLLGDVYFFLGLIVATQIILKTINLINHWYLQRAAQVGREEEISPFITMLARVSKIFVLIASVTILLSHFGINVTAFAAALGIGGLAISLGARDTVADAIAGFIILFDRPFRVGDRIEIEEIGTWGDVTDIGIRTTRIRTRDNRMVIVPNSIISKNQIINYTYPDPRYRIETHVNIPYSTDLDKIRNLIVDTVRTIEGVLPDKPVDALYIEMGESAMVFRVRWWIESYVDTRRMVDRVHSALHLALNEAGIEQPYPIQGIKLDINPADSQSRKKLDQKTSQSRSISQQDNVTGDPPDLGSVQNRTDQ